MIRIIAHRGEEVLTPEHTYPSYDLCLENGVDFLELDVRQSADGEFYIFHDRDLKRVRSDNRLFSNLNSQTINTLDVGSWFSEKFSDERIPRLKDFLNKYSNKASLYFDVKRGSDEVALVNILEQYQLRKELFFWFEDGDQEKRFEQKFPNLRVKKNANTLKELENVLESGKPALIESTYEMCKGELGNICREKGIQLMIHLPSVVTDKSLIPDFKGIDFIDTTHPVQWENILNEEINK